MVKGANQVVWCVAMEQVGVQINGEWKDCLNIEGSSNGIKNNLERERGTKFSFGVFDLVLDGFWEEFLYFVL
jgi:hypothetical protein